MLQSFAKLRKTEENTLKVVQSLLHEKLLQHIKQPSFMALKCSRSITEQLLHQHTLYLLVWENASYSELHFVLISYMCTCFNVDAATFTHHHLSCIQSTFLHQSPLVVSAKNGLDVYALLIKNRNI